MVELTGAVSDIESGIFLYGTLRHLPLLRIVIGDEADTGVPADLPDHAVHRVAGQDFPMIARAAGMAARGLLLHHASVEALARMDFYEAGFDYDRRAVTVVTADGPRRTTVYFPQPGAWNPGPPWDLDDWATRWGPIAERAAREIIGRFGLDDAALIARFRPQIWSRAASYLRAASRQPPQDVRRGFTDADVERQSRVRPYNKYFLLEEQDLRFRRFDGGSSPPVARAAFVSGDAVTVLPYDPARDRVLLIEQFRFGPYVRGDRAPWVLEPIAGRVDAGETPEACAHREALEETGLTLKSLEPVANYYPTPGAMSEYLMSYVGLADLPDDAAGLGGLETEQEDIRAILLGFDALMNLLATGEAENGPLILTALWLAAHRDRLRGDA